MINSVGDGYFPQFKTNLIEETSAVPPDVSINSLAFNSCVAKTQPSTPLPVGLGKGTALAKGIESTVLNYWSQPLGYNHAIYDAEVFNALAKDANGFTCVNRQLEEIDRNFHRICNQMNVEPTLEKDTNLAELESLKDKARLLETKIDKVIYWHQHYSEPQ